ncbi:MAG: tyrosine-type recombinase/integrase [Nanoarchaeota archaeon]
MEDIYNVQQRLDSVSAKIKKSSMPEQNKEKILEFANYCLANSVGKNKTSRYLYDLHNISIWLNKKFEDTTKKDIEKIMVKIQETKYSEWTKKGYKIIIKKFYKWLRNSKNYPEEVEWIKSNMKENHKKLPEEMLSEGEVMKMIDNSISKRDKALISVLYDSGCRIGELLGLKIKNIEESEYGAKICISGKTGMRKILLIFSAPYLFEWINNHSNKNPSNFFARCS